MSSFKDASIKSSAYCYDCILKMQGKARNKSSFVATVEDKLKAAGINLDELGIRDPVSSCPSHGATAAASSTTEPDRGASVPKTGKKSVEQKRLESARVLSDRELMWTQYFSGMLDDCVEVVEESLEEPPSLRSLEVSMHDRRVKQRNDRACDLPVKVFLTPLQRCGSSINMFASFLEMIFGPFHASLRVGQVILEWDDSSLVIPRHCDHAERLIKVNVESYSRWTESIGQREIKEEVEQVFVIASKKKEMLDKLIDKVVEYNRSYAYNLFTRNCQHFVMDCLNALGVNYPEQLKGDLRDYYKKLKIRLSPSVSSSTKLKTHRDLDEYVKKIDLRSLTPHDLEYILALYFRFHVESKEKIKDDRKKMEEWTCPEADCCMNYVDQLVDHGKLLIHDFLQA